MITLRNLNGTNPGQNGKGFIAVLLAQKAFRDHIFQKMEDYSWSNVVKEKIRTVAANHESHRGYLAQQAIVHVFAHR